MRKQAIRFYEALQQEFPHSEIARQIDAITSDEIEYWRNASVALLAIAKHSVNKYGTFSPDKYERNRKRLDTLRESLAPDVLFQA